MRFGNHVQLCFLFRNCAIIIFNSRYWLLNALSRDVACTQSEAKRINGSEWWYLLIARHGVEWSPRSELFLPIEALSAAQTSRASFLALTSGLSHFATRGLLPVANVYFTRRDRLRPSNVHSRNEKKRKHHWARFSGT